ncbi:MAG: hypothetical protein WEA29_07095 [Acidimicrobiia bacterium]
MTRSRLVALVAVLLVLVPAAVLVWVRLGVEDRLAGLHQAAPPLETVATFREDVGRQPVNVSVVWGEPRVVVAPSWFGLVTGVMVSAGDVVGDGDSVVVVDGVRRMAVASSAPFYRRLASGDRGDDVVMLEEALVRLGYLATAGDGVVRQSMLTAVRALAVDLGVVGTVSGFDPGWLVWLSEDGFEVAEVAVVVGMSAPGQGAPLLHGPRRIAEITVASFDGASVSLPGSWEMEVGGVVVGLEDGVPDPAGVLMLSAALDPLTDVVSGVVRLSVPRVVMDVPAAAVVSGGDGLVCVYVPDGDGFVAVPVVLGSGRAGTVEVVSGLADGDVVLANPADVLAAPACR